MNNFTRPKQPIWLVCIAILVLCYYWFVQQFWWLFYSLKDRVVKKDD